MVKKTAKNEFDTLIVTVLDCSGSMSPRVGDVIGNYNWFIGEQKKIGRAKVSLYRFDTEYETIYENIDINDAPELTTEEYFARGGTALLDAVGKTIKAVDKIRNKPAKIIVAVNTDGQENSSKTFKLDQVAELVEERTSNHDWQFVYLGAGIDEFAREAHRSTASSMNFVAAAAAPASAEGYSWSTHSLNRSVTGYRTGETQNVTINNNVTPPTPAK